MRQISAESREIDLMMQWKAAKHMPTRAFARLNLTRFEILQRWLVAPRVAGMAMRVAVVGVLMAAGLAAGAQSLQPTRTQLSVSQLQSASQASPRAGSQTETILTAQVTDTLGRALPEGAGAGTVSFLTGEDSLGSAIVDEQGVARLSVTGLPAAKTGTQIAVRAVYAPAATTESASSTTAGSISAAALVTPDANGVPNFEVTANPTSLTVPRGQYGTTLLTVTPMNGFSQQVTLSCSALPAQVTCNFSPVIATTAGGAFTSILEIQTQAASGALAPLNPGRGSHVAYAWLLPGMLALAGFAALRRRAMGGAVRAAGMVLLLLVGGLGLSGCSTRYGYIHHPPLVSTGTLAGTYTITVSASGNDGSAVTVHNVPVALQVQ